MALFFGRGKKEGGIKDMIRCPDEPYLIWKWHPAGTEEGETKRENAIRSGSSLRVKDGEVAVFVYRQKDGSMQDFIEGPFDQILKTANLPILSSIHGMMFDGGTPFQAEVYFINMARAIQVKFGVPFFDVFDPRFLDFGVPVAVRGTVSFGISDYREFIKLHRLASFDLDDFQKQIRDAVNRYVKNTVANAPMDHQIPVIQLDRSLERINTIVEENLQARLKRDFGVNVSGVDIGTIEIDKQSEGYRSLMSVTKDLARENTIATSKAQTTAQTRDILEQQQMNSEHMRESLRIQREEGQYAQRMQTQSLNADTYRMRMQAKVGIAAANAAASAPVAHGGMGGGAHIGMNTGKVTIAGGGMGVAPGANINPTAMMSALGGGAAMGGAIGGAMGARPMAAPPPPPVNVAFHVAMNGQTVGPYNVGQFSQMLASGQVNAETMVWKEGMASWQPAGTVPELMSLFGGMPPPPPPPMP